MKHILYVKNNYLKILNNNSFIIKNNISLHFTCNYLLFHFIPFSSNIINFILSHIIHHLYIFLFHLTSFYLTNRITYLSL